MRVTCIIAGFMASFLVTNALRDVPVGYCHDCEISCFEDCSLKYDREITVPDNTGTDRLSRKETRVEAHMKKKMYGVVLNQNETRPVAKTLDHVKLSSKYSACLKQDKCPCSHDTKTKASSFLATAGKCGATKRPCALGCVKKTVGQSYALTEAASRVDPGPKDADDAAIPWSVNVHPVKINTFSTGRQSLEQCFKSCLAATCGCSDAPGMEAIEDMNNAIKTNDLAKDPVEDSPPMWQYKHADIVDCGKGMQGKKITKGLYVDIAGGPEGWVEICSEEFFTAQGTPADIGMKNCDNGKALLAGCLWNEVKGACVYGLNKMFHCYTRYTDDYKL